MLVLPYVAENVIFMGFFDTCVFMLIFLCNIVTLNSLPHPLHPPPVTNRQKSSLKSLKIKTCLVPAKSIKGLCLQNVRQSK